MAAEPGIAPAELEAIRRSRRRPRVLHGFCGSPPYNDLFPAGAEVIELDVVWNPYGVADVVSDEF